MASRRRVNRSGELLAQLVQQEGIKNPSVLNAIATTPREAFVPPALVHRAYENNALPIGQGQTISQPYIVAKMTELLLEHGCSGKVLEIGTGCGYQTAVLAPLFDQVFSVERIKSLQYQAKVKLQQLDLHNVSMKHGDGWQGWKSKAPFSGIIVTAAASEVPQKLLEQLTNGGVLVVPVGEDMQVLKVIRREGDEYISQDIEDVRFVPLVAGDLA
jgi:protein-L-isoaspartate(D-aspartate) O-methyltransferase